MKRSFTNFWKRNLGFFRLAAISNLEYRFNYFSDAVLQPVCSTLIELTLWYAVFASSNRPTIGGFGREYYLAYAMWVAFISRITANWMYEFRMIEEVESGTVNSVLARPISFYEYYLSQFMGYKIVTTLISITIPLGATLLIDSPVSLARVPAALLLVVFYLFLAHTMSFCVASCALYFNRVYSLTMAKNLTLWLLGGELFPLDLLPEPWRSRMIALPFSSGAYIPTGYLTGRFGNEQLLQGYASTAMGLVFFGLLAKILWSRGMLRYTGDGRMKTLRKYLYLQWAFFRASFAADVEYRFNIFLHIFTDITWYAAQIVTFEVIYRQTPMLGTWNLEKTRIFLGLLFIADACYMIFLQDNLNHMADDVRKGQLDLLLMKPVNAQYMVSCRRVGVAYLVNLSLAVGWLAWAIHEYSQPLPLARVLWLLLLIPSGLFVLYGMRFIFSAVSVITVRADNLQYLWYQFYRLGMRPDTIYSTWLKYAVLTLLPMGLIASVPARAPLDEPNYGLFLWALAMGLLSLWASARFWKYALSFYSSASS